MKTVETVTRLLAEMAEECQSLESERNLLVKEVASLNAEVNQLKTKLARYEQ